MLWFKRKAPKRFRQVYQPESDRVSEVASRLLATCWDGELVRTPVAVMAWSLGMQVTLRGGPGDESYVHFGRYLAGEGGLATAEVNARMDLASQRFFLAHLVGHRALGHDLMPAEEPPNFYVDVADAREREATQLALEVLLPARSIERAMPLGYYTEERMARFFCVPTFAVHHRLDALGWL